MILKYYLIFCVVAYVLMIFSAYTIMLNISLKIKEVEESIPFFNWLDTRLIGISLIPVVNVLLLFVFLFFGNEIEKEVIKRYYQSDR